MYAYTVADNTFPNVVPLLSGLTVDELSTICGNYAHKFQDKCPYIWKDFNSSDYLTAYLEDTPWMTSFNMDKIGFLRPQVDFYIRPFMLEAYERVKFDLFIVYFDTSVPAVLRTS